MISLKLFAICSVLLFLTVQTSSSPSSSSSSIITYAEQSNEFEANGVCRDHYADIGESCGGIVTRGPLTVYVALRVGSGHCCDAYHQADCMLKKVLADSLCENELYSVVESLKNKVQCTGTTCSNGATGHQVALVVLFAGMVLAFWRNI